MFVLMKQLDTQFLVMISAVSSLNHTKLILIQSTYTNVLVPGLLLHSIYSTWDLHFCSVFWERQTGKLWVLSLDKFQGCVKER
jgi:hypothetical protein